MKELRQMNLSTRIAKLFSKHIKVTLFLCKRKKHLFHEKVEEQVSALKQYECRVALGTPERVLKLCQQVIIGLLLMPK